MRRTLALAVFAASWLALAADLRPAEISAAPAGATSFVAVEPCRLLDTRDGDAPRLGAYTERAVPTAGRCGIPEDATALSLVVTVTRPLGTGYLTVWPSHVARPLAANLNFTTSSTRGNGAVVQLGNDGALKVLVNVAAHVVVDVTGAFVPVDGPVAAGRFVPITPTRLLDTRDDGGRLAPYSSRVVPLPDGVPPDAAAVAINVATTETLGAGFFAAYPTGTGLPLSAVLNADAANQTRAAGVIVPVNEGGFEVFSQRGEHVIVDITGYFSGDGADTSEVGLFVPIPPARLVDSRLGGKSVFRGGTLILDPTPLVGPASAVVGNWTVTASTAAGFVSVYPAFTPRPLVSTTNVERANSTVGSMAIPPVTEVGIAVYLQPGGHLVADLFGWFTGAPAAATLDLAPIHSGASTEGRKVLMVGDSTLAGLRWYTSGQVALRGADYTIDAESCRRLIGLSCVGREGRRPPNAVDAINAHPGSLDVVVIMTGYNDWYTVISNAFDQVVAAARNKGATEVLWLTYRLGASYTNPTGQATNDSYDRANDIIRAKVASGLFPDVRVADWSQYTADADHWFPADGVHLTLTGAFGVADFIARHLAHGWDAQCPAPWTPGGGIENPCSNPDAVTPVVDVHGVYNTPSSDVYCYQIGTYRLLVCSFP